LLQTAFYHIIESLYDENLYMLKTIFCETSECYFSWTTTFFKKL